MVRAIVAIVAVGGLLTLTACELEAEPAPGTAASKEAAVSPQATVSTSAAPEKRTVTETEKIPYKTRKVDDPTLTKGDSEVRRRGVRGVKKVTYEVTFSNGVETDRKVIREVVTKKPVARIIAVGTKQEQRCDSNYSGACVPIASDVDCQGGSGNGPAYVQGPVRVVGSDIYDLDRDGDGTACDT